MKRLIFWILIFMFLFSGFSSIINAEESHKATVIHVKDQDAIFWDEIETSIVYVVQPWDTLRKIAKKILGDPDKWRILYQNNKLRSANPDLIFPMEVIKISGRKEKSKENVEAIFVNGKAGNS